MTKILDTNRIIQQKTQADSNELVLDIQSDESNQIKNVPAKISLLYAKREHKLKDNEQSQLESFGIECNTALVAEQQNLICQRPVNIEMTVFSPEQNIYKLNYKLKHLIIIELYWETSCNLINLARFYSPLLW